MYALKKSGIIVSVITLLIIGGAFLLANSGYYRLDVRMLLTPMICAIALFGWCKFVRIESVQYAAYRYAKTLLASSTSIQGQQPLFRQ